MVKSLDGNYEGEGNVPQEKPKLLNSLILDDETPKIY